MQNIGTCSWKYDSWRGLIYSAQKDINYLKEYSQYYSTVEIDQWFWSLFGEKVVLPRRSVVEEYHDSVPEGFLFAIKVPNALTLTHHYTREKKTPLLANHHFLSLELMGRFLDSIAPLRNKIGPLIFQFEYLNKKKMSGKEEFLERLIEFIQQLPREFHYCIECRNPNYLDQSYFAALADGKLSHVFLQGYYMPSIFQLYRRYVDFLDRSFLIRLHGPDRKEIEKLTASKWHAIVAPKDKDIEQLRHLLEDACLRNLHAFVYVNNHFEGSAPRTISKILDYQNT